MLGAATLGCSFADAVLQQYARDDMADVGTALEAVCSDRGSGLETRWTDAIIVDLKYVVGLSRESHGSTTIFV